MRGAESSAGGQRAGQAVNKRGIMRGESRGGGGDRWCGVREPVGREGAGAVWAAEGSSQTSPRPSRAGYGRR